MPPSPPPPPQSPGPTPYAAPARTALVTGAASGIGLAIAERLAFGMGARIAVVDKNADGAQQAARSILQRGGQAQAFVADLRDPAAIHAMLLAVDEALGPPDVVVNNAGIASTASVLDHSLELWRATLDVNVTAPFLIVQHTLAAMRRKGWGRVVNVASISGVRAGTGRLSYGSSKAALIALTRQFAIESAEWGVTVNAIAPGPVDTPLVRGLHGGSTTDTYARMVPMRRYATPDEVAHAALFLSSPEASYITGETLAVDGGFLASGLLVHELFEQPPSPPSQSPAPVPT